MKTSVLGLLGLVCSLQLALAFMVPHQAVDKRLRRGDNHKRTGDKVSYSECATPAFERMDCGYFGITDEQCYERDCCWTESNIPGVPWCYHTIGNSPEQCVFDDYDKEDCGYYGINSEECTETNGCCWMPSEVPTIPWCYFPTAPTFAGDCGIPAIDPAVIVKIVGGEEAIPHSWPWQVSMQIGYHFCGGSLVAPRWVVSAAHCASAFDYGGGEIKLGMHNLFNTDGSEITAGVELVIPHPSYNGMDIDNDILLIKLDQEIEYTENISPVCLPPMNEEMAEGSQCYTTGWGTLQAGGSSPEVLQQVMVPIIERDTCNLPDWYGGSVTENMICAGYEEGGKDSCQGDSGGPFICRVDGRWVLTGIVSWGEGCAWAKRPGVYTNTAKFIDWVEETMEANS